MAFPPLPPVPPMKCATMCYMNASARAKVVGVRELRQNLSVYLTRVKKGQVLTVTEHGQAVAELRPLAAPENPVARLIASGAVQPARRAVSALPKPAALRSDRSASDLLDEQRHDIV